MKKKCIIFDLDGTILNTLEDIKNAVNHALIVRNLPKRTLEDIRLTIGHGVHELIARNIPDGHNNPEHLNILKDFRNYYFAHLMDTTVPYEGIIEELNNLKEEGYKIAVCTNKLDSSAQTLIKHFFDGIFDYVLGSNEVVKKKPAPDMINLVIKELGVNKEECLYVGDTEIDYFAATNANIDVLVVNYGYRKEQELKEEFNIDKSYTLGELFETIKKWA
jgi:phosphoglycolate phosphatase